MFSSFSVWYIQFIVSFFGPSYLFGGSQKLKMSQIEANISVKIAK